MRLRLAHVDRVDTPGFPVGPIEPILVERDGERILQALADYRASIAALVIHHGDEAQFTVHPVDEFAFVVHRQAVRPVYVVGHDYLARARITIHAGALDFRHVAPIGPEEEAPHGCQGDRARLINVRPEKHLPVIAVEADHLDQILLAIRPIQLARNPIAGKTVGRYQIGVHYSHLLARMRAIGACALYRLETAVGPADQLALVIEIERRDVRQLLDDDIDLVVARHVGHSEVLLGGKEKNGRT